MAVVAGECVDLSLTQGVQVRSSQNGKDRRALLTALNEEKSRRASAVEQISASFGISKKTASRTLGLLDKKETRAANLRNAWLHVRKFDPDSFPVLTGEERILLAECIKLQTDDGYTKLKETASVELVNKLRDILSNYRETKRTIPRDTNRSRGQQFRQTTESVGTALKQLGAQTGASYCLVVTRGETDHTHEPFAIMDRKAEEFLQVGCGIMKESFATRMEAYACAGIRALTNANNAKRTLDVRSQVRELVRSGLHIILGDSRLRVPWSNYESFVSRHRVILDGWPTDLPMDPEKLSLPGLTVLLQSLKDGTCKWRRITDEEYAQRAAQLRAANKQPTLKVRATRSDAGKKKKPGKSAPEVRSRSFIDSDED